LLELACLTTIIQFDYPNIDRLGIAPQK